MSQIKAEYISHMGRDIDVVNAARVSFGKFKEEMDGDDEKLLNYLAKHNHLTPFEHVTLSVRIKCPLYIRSQIHRHRTFSYNEISRRYTAENLEIYLPETIRKQHKTSKQCSDGEFNEVDNQYLRNKIDSIHRLSLDVYNKLIEDGVAREMARGVLPQNLMTEFVMTGNLRNWVHFLGLRLDNHAQEEVQQVAQPILEIINEHFPKSAEVLFKHQITGYN